MWRKGGGAKSKVSPLSRGDEFVVGGVFGGRQKMEHKDEEELQRVKSDCCL